MFDLDDKDKTLIILIVPFVACTVLFFLYAFSNTFLPEGYAVHLDKTDTPPYQYINLTESDIDRFPLLGTILDAYNNTGGYPSAYMFEDTLIFKIERKDWEAELMELHDYLRDRMRTETGRSDVYFSYANPDSGMTYIYEWDVSVP